MSGVGKTTIANELVEKISYESGLNIVPIDGDIVRLIDGNNVEDSSYSIDSRYKNAKRIQKISLALDKSGENVICSILCIFPEILKENIKLFSSYYEVFLDASIEELKRRDTKGLYEMARRGKISNLVGYDIDFPIPENSNLTLRTDKDQTASELSNIIFNTTCNKLRNDSKDSSLATRLRKAEDTETYAKIISEKIKPYNS
jgi:adenylylsulfate kinase-like enzyme